MPIVPRNLHTKYRLKTKELVTYYCGNLVTIATRCVADAYCPKENSMSNMNTIRPKTKQLVTYYCGCHRNLVTIATRYVADAYCPKEHPYQIST